MTTIHDVFRFLVRGGPNTESNIHRLLLTIDAHEKGYPDLEAYEAELEAQAAALAAAPAPADAPSAEARAAEAEARLARLEALMAAQSRPAAAGRGGENAAPSPGVAPA